MDTSGNTKMSIEQKAKAYDEALNWMRELHPRFPGAFKEEVEHYFPGLRESESERIRKAIVLGIKRCADAGSIFGTVINNEGVNYHDVLAYLEKQKEQKPAEKQDYSGLNDLERAIHRGFLSAGVENVPVTIIKETAKECLEQMNPAEWNDTDMKEARNNLISVCRDWERGEKTTLLPIVAVRARYFLEHLIEPKKPAEWSGEDEKKIHFLINLIERNIPDATYSFGDGCKYGRISKKEAIEMLKSLRPSWKPSEEQMSALDKAIPVCMGVVGRDEIMPLESLYEQLKKLM